jgi:prophage regulatory protein
MSETHTSQRSMSRPRQVLERLPISPATMWRQIGDGTFPKPVRIGKRSVAFFDDEIDAWLKARSAERAA